MARRMPTFNATDLDAQYQPIVRLWILRALVRCNGMKEFLHDIRFDDLSVAQFIGFTDEDIDNYCPRKAAASLARKLAAAERERPTLPSDTTVGRNIARLAGHLGLGHVACELLHFVTIQRNHAPLSAALDAVGQLTMASIVKLLAVCLGRSVGEVKCELDNGAKLPDSAILAVDRDSTFSFQNKVDMLEGLAEELTFEHQDLTGLFSASIVSAEPARLSLDDYRHVAADAEILRSYLTNACRAPQTGVNVLIYGPSGTGKTEFVKTLAQTVGLRLHEIPTQDKHGSPRTGKKRFDACRFAQSLLAGASSQALLFDEVEDVFCDPKFSRDDNGNTSGLKGWVNRLLETNPVPTFWVTNHLGAIDRAYRRRFDFVVHLDVPPRSVRKRLLDRIAAPLELDERWREEAASHPALVPAVIERAVRVSSIVCSATPELGAERVVTRVMNNTLEALGAGRIKPQASQPVGDYRLDLLNADCDLERLREGLRRVGEGRICLYGPPGTGKTAFGRHVAHALDRPLLVKRASDILSPYVGMAERNIADMFEEAEQDGAVLLLDEADSLLRDRRSAQRSWEVTQVNEMLTQMESFPGIFIASTNLMDSLDEASMRRFDAKVRLDYLKPAQAVTMFEGLAKDLGIEVDGTSIERLTAAGVRITPGDFAAIARGARLDAPANAQALVCMLLASKTYALQRVARPIGFLANSLA